MPATSRSKKCVTNSAFMSRQLPRAISRRTSVARSISGPSRWRDERGQRSIGPLVATERRWGNVAKSGPSLGNVDGHSHRIGECVSHGVSLPYVPDMGGVGNRWSSSPSPTCSPTSRNSAEPPADPRIDPHRRSPRGRSHTPNTASATPTHRRRPTTDASHTPKWVVPQTTTTRVATPQPARNTNLRHTQEQDGGSGLSSPQELGWRLRGWGKQQARIFFRDRLRGHQLELIAVDIERGENSFPHLLVP
jgi:hypothetical protein